MSTPLTASELAFEHWCQLQRIEYRRVRVAKAQGHKRPDYAMRVIPHWCFVEIKELAETPADVAMMHELQSGNPSLRWIDPGVRLRQSIKDSAAQLRKFSRRGFPTVVCFFDTTVGFYLERVHVAQAMFGQDTLHFEVSSDPAHDPRFLGMRHGKKATLTSRNNTSISAVAILRQPSGSDLMIDLHHNPRARVPIPRTLSAPFVRKQHAEELDDPDPFEPSVLDLMQSDEWQEWLDNPEGKCDREVEKCLREFRSDQAP